MSRPGRRHGRRRRWTHVVDAAVLSLHRNGFLQSLIFHVAVLLAMALTVIETQRLPTPVMLAVAFDAATDGPVELDEVAVAAEPFSESPVPQPLAADVPIPAEAWQEQTDQSQLSHDAADLALASLDVDQPVAGIDMEEMLAEVPGGIQLTSFAAASRGQHGGVPGESRGFGGELGRRLKAAGARTGDVQVSIAWDNFNDIDVHVMVEAVAPRRGVSMINFSNRRGACGGWLDVDQNVVPMTPTPVENVFWARGTAPYGRYTVYVHQFRNWGGADPTAVRVAVLVDGMQSHHTAVVPAGSGPVAVTNFVRRRTGTIRANADGFDDPMAPSSPP